MQTAEQDDGSHKRTIYLLSAGFFGIFLAFNTSQALQSTLNASLGNACLATLYAAFTAVCIPGPKLVSYFNPKWAMVIGGAAYVLMILANIGILHLDGHLGAQYGIGIPFNLLVGIGAPLLWTGQSLYLSRTAEQYVSAIQGGKEETRATLSDYNATFFSMFQANGVVGLVFASLLKTCAGSGQTTTTVLFAVLSVACALGVFLLSTLPNSPAIVKADRTSSGYIEDAADDADEDDVSISETLTFMVRESRMFCFIPIVLFNGMSLGFIFGDYTKYVIGEALGDSMVGFGTATFYGVNTLVTLLFGRPELLAVISRRMLMYMAFFLQAGFFIFFLLAHHSVIGLNGDNMSNFVPPGTKVPGRDVDTKEWVQVSDPAAFSYVAVFAGAVVFAVADSVWESVLPGVIQGYFIDEGDKAVNSAMANLKMWQSLGFASQFAIGATFPSLNPDETVMQHFWLKLAILLGILVVGFVGMAYITARFPIDNVQATEQSESKAHLIDEEIGSRT